MYIWTPLVLVSMPHFTTWARAQTIPAAWLMQSIVKQQPWRLIRQHCALYTIQVYNLDIQQRPMILFTVWPCTAVHKEQSSPELSILITSLVSFTQIRDREAKLGSSTCHQRETDTVILEWTHLTTVNNIKKNCYPRIKLKLKNSLVNQSNTSQENREQHDEYFIPQQSLAHTVFSLLHRHQNMQETDTKHQHGRINYLI